MTQTDPPPPYVLAFLNIPIIGAHSCCSGGSLASRCPNGLADTPSTWISPRPLCNPPHLPLWDLNDASAHLLAIRTSLLYHRICVFLPHLLVRWFFISHQLVCAFHTTHSRSADPSPLTPLPPAKNIWYMKCSRSRPALCATDVQPVTGDFTIFITQGKDTT